MIVVVFRSRPKPGFEAVAVVEFESLETLKAWREHPEHLAAQAAGRERFFESYRIQVCRVERDYAFP